ncbi:MAG: hypothetical protein P4M13_06160 [Alphaproteobacteria bacterium]|nr:hypothetical protein [Alphaproteobacteria bacterium]
MAGWLQNILTPPAKAAKASHLPMQTRKGANLPAQPLRGAYQTPQALPNATIIYGIGASLLFVSSFFLLVAGRWLPAVTVFAMGACLTGFAVHLMKHQD